MYSQREYWIGIIAHLVWLPPRFVDNRFSDDIHWKGGCVLGTGLLSWSSTMYAWNARPPHPANSNGLDWKEEWRKRLELASNAWAGKWLKEQVCGMHDMIKKPFKMQVHVFFMTVPRNITPIGGMGPSARTGPGSGFRSWPLAAGTTDTPTLFSGWQRSCPIAGPS